MDELPEAARTIVHRRCGDLRAVEAVPVGQSAFKFVLTTELGRVFLKGTTGPRAAIEARVQPHLPPIAPRLLWHEETGDLHLLAFEHIEGRYPDLRLASPDLALIADALGRLSFCQVPDLPVLPAERRFGPLTDPASAALLTGRALVHTDPVKENFLIHDGRVTIVDWAWPTFGAAWLDTLSMAVRLIEAGHSLDQAHQWAGQIPAWHDATPDALAAYATVRAAVARRNGNPIERTWNLFLGGLAQSSGA
ncbi:hypothetical protein [Actinomadura hibisca]|uniref:hypothetical protein n=1 Tax=Actinomadura hibisca TaxID=68565 RepID=UPI000833A6DF|nr:hypothetical protein [Actinomadura hibisca]